MVFPLYACVCVIAFTFSLWWLPSPLNILPVLAALLFPLYPEEAAFTAYVVALFYGTVFHALRTVTLWRDGGV